MRVNIPIVIDMGGSTGNIFEKGKTAAAYTEKGGVTGVFYIEMIDDEQLPRNINLSFSPSKLGKQAGATPIKVTATLDGGALTSHDLETQLVVVEGKGATSDTLARDVNFSISGLGKLTIPKGKTEATMTITVDPSNKAGKIVLGVSASGDTTLKVKSRNGSNSAGKQVRLDFEGMMGP